MSTGIVEIGAFLVIDKKKMNHDFEDVNIYIELDMHVYHLEKKIIIDFLFWPCAH